MQAELIKDIFRLDTYHKCYLHPMYELLESKYTYGRSYDIVFMVSNMC